MFHSCEHSIRSLIHFHTVPFNYIRLVDGDSVMEGRVEVYHDGGWGSICYDGWDIKDAMVVCHQLGYPRAIRAPEFSVFGEADPSSRVRNDSLYLYGSLAQGLAEYYVTTSACK